MLCGDAVARAKVGSEGGVEVAAKTGGSGGGVRDRFLKDASRGTCCAPRGGAGGGEGGEEKVDCARTVERNDHRRAARKLTGVAGEIRPGGERVERREE